ncbi:hypothetical protein RIF29_21020 [Crotalaria pallida]|uniref:TF-B3 domain-containing protein n=1 Tax=Crotalaria pallida TaxID=3830 RepID=A0AAN9F237_CROPI
MELRSSLLDLCIGSGILSQTQLLSRIRPNEPGTSTSNATTVAIGYRPVGTNLFPIFRYKMKPCCASRTPTLAPSWSKRGNFILATRLSIHQSFHWPLPRSHVQDYLSAKMEHEAILIHGDNCTLVTMSTVPTKSSCFLTNGWKRFAVGNGFTDDDEFEVKVYMNDVGQIMLEFHKIRL